MHLAGIGMIKMATISKLVDLQTNIHVRKKLLEDLDHRRKQMCFLIGQMMIQRMMSQDLDRYMTALLRK